MAIQLQTVEGTIEHLATGQMLVDLLQQHVSKGAQGAAAVVQAMTDNNGLAASSASVAMADTEEEMTVFAFWVDGQMIQGMLPHVSFQNGDEVRVVFEAQDEKNDMVAIWRKRDNLLWMPLMRGWGVGATFKSAFITMGWLSVFNEVFVLLFLYFQKVKVSDYFFVLMTAMPFGLWVFFALWDFFAYRHNGQLSTAVFRALGLPKPVWLDLRPYSLIRLKNDLNGECVYDLNAMKNPPQFSTKHNGN